MKPKAQAIFYPSFSRLKAVTLNIAETIRLKNVGLGYKFVAPV